MNPKNIFVALVDSVRQLGGNGRGVLIVRQTKLFEIESLFDKFLTEPEIANHFQYKKESNPDFPQMVIYRVEGKEEHIVIGVSEEGWKGDYGLTHTDVVVSIH